jgi:hypothetical protein
LKAPTGPVRPLTYQTPPPPPSVQPDATERATVTLCGHPFTLVENPPGGAFLVFSYYLRSKDPIAQLAAVPTLLTAWIVEEEHQRLLDVVAEISDLDAFMETELPILVAQVTERPTRARAS